MFGALHQKHLDSISYGSGIRTRVMGDGFCLRDVQLGAAASSAAPCSPGHSIAADDQEFADRPLFSKSDSMIETPARSSGMLVYKTTAARGGPAGQRGCSNGVAHGRLSTLMMKARTE